MDLHTNRDGKSLLPFARVQKIIKADKDIPIVAKEAVFLISVATEEFIKRLTEASRRVANGEKRVTVQQRDIATVVHSATEFVFLDEIIPRPQSVKKLHVVKSNRDRAEVASIGVESAPVEPSDGEDDT
jgi:histone H3/H4